MDVSGSMNATDVTPTRLVAAQRAASSFVEQLPAKFRVGLVSFASTAQTLVRPTTDRVAIQDALASLHAEGATAMGDGIQRALEVKRPPSPPTTRPGSPARPAPPSIRPTPDTATPMVILLLSDGANTCGRTRPLDAAADAEAARGGHRRHSRSVPTPAWSMSLTGTANSAPPGSPDPTTLHSLPNRPAGAPLPL